MTEDSCLVLASKLFFCWQQGLDTPQMNLHDMREHEAGSGWWPPANKQLQGGLVQGVFPGTAWCTEEDSVDRSSAFVDSVTFQLSRTENFIILHFAGQSLPKSDISNLQAQLRAVAAVALVHWQDYE